MDYVVLFGAFGFTDTRRDHWYLGKLTKTYKQPTRINVKGVSQLQKLNDVETDSFGFKFSNPGMIDVEPLSQLALT
ncbi:hypothetical protein OIU13_00050 [Brevundimonas sp. BT-123]|nr:hypothetical protein [Brevundimonas sp. BT-123]MCW0044930.1 hypothetical protein [Brevundimonas sp. BT-123]